jgi:hypothetical protein
LKDLLRVGCGSILNKYNSSLYLLVSSIYSEYEWLPWKFTLAPINYWNSINNHKRFIDWASKQLNIKDMSDWYKVSYRVINNIDIN